MTYKQTSDLFISVLIGTAITWFCVDATESIVRGLIIGFIITLCFFGFKNAVLDDSVHKSEGERSKIVIIYHLIFGIIFYFVIQYGYYMTNLNSECYINDNDQACASLEYIISN